MAVTVGFATAACSGFKASEGELAPGAAQTGDQDVPAAGAGGTPVVPPVPDLRPVGTAATPPPPAAPVPVPGASNEPNCELLASGEQLAFPGAEGFGRLARGGRGGAVYHVTNLDDTGTGSLRAAVSQPNRTVVFDVSGWITLASDLAITQSSITIAGQTAPGGGIGVRGMKFSIASSDVIVRFMRMRKGDITSATDRDDAMSVESTARNVIVDHVSVGFGTDENFSMPGDEGVGPQNLTVQWSIIGYAVQRNNHSAGSLLTASGLSIHHTLWGLNKTRNPRARSENGAVLDWVNNVIYGWNAPDPVGMALMWDISSHAFIMGGTADGSHRANVVGNYFISTLPASSAFVSGGVDASGVPTYGMFFAGNLLDGNGNGNGTLDVSSADEGMIDGAVTLLPERLPAPQVCSDEAPVAYDRVLAGVGATLPARDEVDSLLVDTVRTQTGILIQHETDLPVGDSNYGTLESGVAPTDTDQDGMPDVWEEDRALTPADPEDRNGDDDGDGYTNLEEYLNELALPAWDF